MKTQRRTLRGMVTSSMLALALAAGMMPAAGLAYAAEQASEESVVTEEPQEAAGAHPASPTEETATEEPSQNVIPSDAEGSQASEAGEGEDAVETPAATEAPAATGIPAYTTNSAGITAADVPLTTGQAAEPAAGTIEYAGIAYTINPDDPNTVSVTGLATEKPKGEVQIQSQVAAGDKLYSVSGIEMCGGGVHRKTLA